jgi:hypothetical protein
MKKPLLLLAGLMFWGWPTCLAGISVVGNLVRTHSVKAGEPFEGIIIVRNNGENSTDARFFQTDYLFFSDGRNLYGDPGTAPRSNAGWITISPSRTTLPPKATTEVHYKGIVPEGADLKGSYWSMLIVEPAAPPAPVVNGDKKEITVGLQTMIRFGIQIVSEIGDTGSRSLKVLDKSLVSKDGKRSFKLDVENTGERLQIPAMSMELFNKDGISVGKLDGGKSRIYSTCSVRYSVDLTEIPPGKYTALVILDNGDDHVTGAQYQLEL